MITIPIQDYVPMLSPITVYSGTGKHLRTQQNASKRHKTTQNAVKCCKTPQNAAKRSKCSRGLRQFAAKRRKNSNYIRDSESQDSNNQTSNHENGNENERRGLHGNMQGRGLWE